MLQIEHDGKTYYGEPDDLRQAGVPEALIADAAARQQAAEAKQRLRRRIHLSAGDAESLLGTTADAVQILLYEIGKLAQALNAAGSLAEVRAAAQPLSDLLGPLAAAVDAGTVKLPYQVKGGPGVVLPEIQDRATQVADVLAAGQS